MAVKKEIVRSGWLEVVGILLVTLAVLCVLAVFSYDPGDIRVLQSPPNDPPANFIGPMGAWFAFLIFMGLGVAGYLAPLSFAYIGLICLFKREGRLWTKVVWSLTTLAAVAALLELNAGGWASWRAELNVGSTGGAVGDLLTARSLVLLWGPIGTGILMTGLLLIGLVMMMEVRPGTLLRNAWEIVLSLYDRWEVARKARMDRVRQLEEEQREVMKRRRRLEEAMKSTEAAPAVKVRGRKQQPEVEPAPVEPRGRRAAPVEEPPDPVPLPEDEPVEPSVGEEAEPEPETQPKKGFGLFGRKGKETPAEPAEAPVPEPAPVQEVSPTPSKKAPEPVESVAVLPSSGANWTLPPIAPGTDNGRFRRRWTVVEGNALRIRRRGRSHQRRTRPRRHALRTASRGRRPCGAHRRLEQQHRPRDEGRDGSCPGADPGQGCCGD